MRPAVPDTSFVQARRHYAMWMFTGACPSNCTYCDIDSQKKKKGLSGPEVARVCQDILDAGFSEVMFAGGEPLLSPHLPDALALLSGKVKTVVFTGGLPGMAQRAVEVLGAGGVDRLVFSIDSGRSAQNDLIRGRKGVTADLLEMAAAVRDRLPHIGRSVNTVVSRFNVDDLASVWERMQPYGFRSWSLTLAGDFFEGSPGHALLSVEALERLYFETVPALSARLARDGAELVVLPVPLALLASIPPRAWSSLGDELRAQVRVDLERFSRGEHNASFVAAHKCPLVGIDVVIGVGGEIHPCSQAPIIDPRWVVGNVRQDRLVDVLDGDAVRSFAAGVPHAPCTRCWAPSNVPRERLAQLVKKPLVAAAATR